MWIRTSSVLLATLVVSGLSFPHPDASQYDIPEVGTGQRSQYYVLHSDGTFKYGFDSGDGAFESVKSRTTGNRDGKFGYVDPDGNTIQLEYEAGKGGFVARGDHLPKPSPELARALAAVVRSATPYYDPLASEYSDASYGFRFSSDDHSRNEQSDADGTVTGSYSYVDENGVTRSFTYRAGKGIGFVIEGDGLTQDINTPTLRQSTRVLPSPARRTDYQSSRSSPRRLPTPSRPFGASVRASQPGQQANIISTQSQTPGDASYSFSYNAGDHSRSETSDPRLNVDGTYSFVGDDGEKRTVTYGAGSGTGFRAEGSHLPRAREFPFGERLSSDIQRTPNVRTGIRNLLSSRQRTPTSDPLARGHTFQRPTTRLSQDQSPTYRQTGFQLQQLSPPAISGQRYSQSSVLAAAKRDSFSSPSRKFEEANTRSSFTPQGPYSFSYETPSHSRSEFGDEDNNVAGNFAFISEDDGQVRQINYEAGSATGFIAEGDHIPTGPIVPGSPTGQPTGRLVKVPSVRFVDPLANSNSDASYNFGFDSETYSRSESADEDGNVVGTYTVVNDDGVRVTYSFRAGKGIGFETEEVSRTQGPIPARPIPYRGPLAGDSSDESDSRSTSFRDSEVGHVTRVSDHRRYRGDGKPFETHTSSRRTHSLKPSYRPDLSGIGSKTSLTPSSILRSSLASHQSKSVFPGYTLHSYDNTPNAEKFGYVLKYDD